MEATLVFLATMVVTGAACYFLGRHFGLLHRN